MSVLTEIAEFVENLMTMGVVGIQLEEKELEVYNDAQAGYDWGYYTFLDEDGTTVDHGKYGIMLHLPHSQF